MSHPDDGRPASGTPRAADEPDGATGDAAVAGPGHDRTGTAGNGGEPDADLNATVVALTRDDLGPDRRRQLLRRLATQVGKQRPVRFLRPRAAARWMADLVSDIAPHIPIRDLDTLRAHHPGLTGEALADRLVRNAARATAGVGAAGGGAAAVQWTVPPTLLTAPVLLAAETVVVVAVELKLVGELHEVYGAPFPGSGVERAVAMIQSWSSQRGVNPLVPGTGVGAVLGSAARKELRDTVLRRFGRHLTTLGPLLTGAAVAGYLNQRATRAMSDRIRADLREQRKGLPPGPVPPS